MAIDSLHSVMSKDVYIVSPLDSLARVRNLFLKKGISRVLVFDEEPLGVLTEKDLARVFYQEHRAIDEVRVRDAMKNNVITAMIQDSPEKTALVMSRKNISGVPVVSEGEIVGIVTKTDLARYFSENYAGETTVEQVMNTKMPLVKEFQSAFHVAKLMAEKGHDRVIVMRDNKPAGIISDRDISLMSFSRNAGKQFIHHRALLVTAGEIMKTKLYTTSLTMDAAEAARKMLDEKIGSLVVMQKGKLRGIFTKKEILEFLAEKAPKKTQ